MNRARALLPAASAWAFVVALGLVLGAAVGRAGPRGRRVLAGADSTPVAGIVVEGKGQAVTRADRLEVHARIVARGQTADQAYDQLADGRRRVSEAFDGCGVDGIEVRSLGPTISYDVGLDPEQSAMFFGNGANVPSEPEVVVREDFEIALGGADELDDDAQGRIVATLVDTALDAGMELPGEQETVQWAGMRQERQIGPIATLELSDRGAVEREAYRAALAVARRRASDLADLAGVALSTPSSVEVLSATEEWSTTRSEHTFETRLRVVFGIE